MAKSRGTEYHNSKGLDWDRLNREYREAASPGELVATEAAAKAIQRGATMAEAKAAGQEAVAKAFPPEEEKAS